MIGAVAVFHRLRVSLRQRNGFGESAGAVEFDDFGFGVSRNPIIIRYLIDSVHIIVRVDLVPRPVPLTERMAVVGASQGGARESKREPEGQHSDDCVQRLFLLSPGIQRRILTMVC